MTPSFTAEAIIKKAEECFALGLITQEKLEYVTQQAETVPGYDDLLDLPFDWDVERERELRRVAALKAEPRTLMRRLLRR